MNTLVHVGWFNDESESIPAHDSGLLAPCPVCGQPLETGLRMTISLMPVKGHRRSMFFRAHRTCWTTASEQQRAAIESQVIDLPESSA